MLSCLGNRIGKSMSCVEAGSRKFTSWFGGRDEGLFDRFIGSEVTRSNGPGVFPEEDAEFPPEFHAKDVDYEDTGSGRVTGEVEPGGHDSPEAG